MAVNFVSARNFVYSQGVLWERQLFAALFQGGDPEQARRSIRAYKNADGGYGNAFEHDIRCPQSHPLALEFLLTVLVQTGLPPGDLLDGTGAWAERQRAEDGSLRNPPELMEYPRAPWWEQGGQTAPDSIVGNLIRFGQSTSALRQSTAAWVDAHLTETQIRGTEWLFMAYHAYDYTINALEHPSAAALRPVVIGKIAELAQQAPEKQWYEIFRFAPTPDSPIAQALSPEFLARVLDHLENTQQEDGGWNDEHGLPQWRPYTTIRNLLTLQRYKRSIGL